AANAGKPFVLAIADNAPSLNSALLGGTTTISGNHNMLLGIRAMGQRVTLRGTGARLRRVLFRGARIKAGSTHPGQCILDARGVLVEYCEMDDSDARGFRFES